MILFLALLQSGGGVHFDATISLGNVLTLLGVALAIIKMWHSQTQARKAEVAAREAEAAAKRDLEWRIKNLEIWRKEHTIDADSRDKIIGRMDKILFHVTNGREGIE